MTSQEISDLIISTATSYGFDPRLALEVGMKESSLNPNVPDSPAGAIGIFQLMPATAAELGVNPRDPAQNIDGGVRYLVQLVAKYAGNVAEALAAFDWGPGNMDKAIAAHGAGWMNYAPIETQDYVQTILGNVSGQYSFSVGTPGQSIPGIDSTATDQASAAPDIAASGNMWWIIGAAFVGWALFEFLR
jgi:soluble lytic murein transglycosylase-like protein